MNELEERIAGLQSDADHYLRSAKEITDTAKRDGRNLTAEETEQIKGLQAKARTAQNEIDQIKRSKEIIDDVDKQYEEFRKPAERVAGPHTVEVTSRTEIEMPRTRYSALRNFRGSNAVENAYKSGQWILANLYGNERAKRWCRNNGVGRPEEMRAMSTIVNTLGGFLVPDEMEQAIIDLREEYGVFRREARVRSMGSDTLSVPRRTSGLTTYWPGEGSAITASDKGFDSVTLVAKKLAALAVYSSEVAEDAVVNIADDLAGEIAYAFAVKEDLCGFAGDGSATYGSIVGLKHKFYGNTTFKGYVPAASSHDTFAEIDNDDLTSLMGALPQFAGMNPKWYCSKPCYALAFGALMAAAGGNTMTDLAGKMVPSYLGYPIVVSQAIETSTADISGYPLLYFGDLSMAATLGSRREIRLAVSSEYKFAEDQIAIKGTQRFDINVHDVGDATQAGPIVALIAN